MSNNNNTITFLPTDSFNVPNNQYSINQNLNSTTNQPRISSQNDNIGKESYQYATTSQIIGNNRSSSNATGNLKAARYKNKFSFKKTTPNNNASLKLTTATYNPQNNNYNLQKQLVLKQQQCSDCLSLLSFYKQQTLRQEKIIQNIRNYSLEAISKSYSAQRYLFMFNMIYKYTYESQKIAFQIITLNQFQNLHKNSSEFRDSTLDKISNLKAQVNVSMNRPNTIINQSAFIQSNNAQNQNVNQYGVTQQGSIQQGGNQSTFNQQVVHQQGSIQQIANQKGGNQLTLNQQGVIQQRVTQQGSIQQGVIQQGTIQQGTVQQGTIQQVSNQTIFNQQVVNQQKILQVGVNQQTSNQQRISTVNNQQTNIQQQNIPSRNVTPVNNTNIQLNINQQTNNKPGSFKININNRPQIPTNNINIHNHANANTLNINPNYTSNQFNTTGNISSFVPIKAPAHQIPINPNNVYNPSSYNHTEIINQQTQKYIPYMYDQIEHPRNKYIKQGFEKIQKPKPSKQQLQIIKQKPIYLPSSQQKIIQQSKQFENEHFKYNNIDTSNSSYNYIVQIRQLRNKIELLQQQKIILIDKIRIYQRQDNFSSLNSNQTIESYRAEINSLKVQISQLTQIYNSNNNQAFYNDNNLQELQEKNYRLEQDIRQYEDQLLQAQQHIIYLQNQRNNQENGNNGQQVNSSEEIQYLRNTIAKYTEHVEVIQQEKEQYLQTIQQKDIDNHVFMEQIHKLQGYVEELQVRTQKYQTNSLKIQGQSNTNHNFNGVSYQIYEQLVHLYGRKQFQTIILLQQINRLNVRWNESKDHLYQAQQYIISLQNDKQQNQTYHPDYSNNETLINDLRVKQEHILRLNEQYQKLQRQYEELHISFEKAEDYIISIQEKYNQLNSNNTANINNNTLNINNNNLSQQRQKIKIQLQKVYNQQLQAFQRKYKEIVSKLSQQIVILRQENVILQKKSNQLYVSLESAEEYILKVEDWKKNVVEISVVEEWKSKIQIIQHENQQWRNKISIIQRQKQQLITQAYNSNLKSQQIIKNQSNQADITKITTLQTQINHLKQTVKTIEQSLSIKTKQYQQIYLLNQNIQLQRAALETQLTKIQGYLSTAETYIQQNQATWQQTKSSNIQLQQIIHQLQLQLVQIRQQNIQLQSKSQQFNQLIIQTNHYKSQYQKFILIIKQKQTIIINNQRIVNQLRISIDNTTKLYNASQGQLIKVKEQVTKMNSSNSNSKWQGEINGLKREIQILSLQNKKYKEEIIRLSIEINRLGQVQKHLINAQEHIKISQQKLLPMINNYQSTIAQLKIIIHQYQAKIQYLNITINNCHLQIDQFNIQINNYHNTINIYHLQIEEYKTVVINLKQEITVYQQQITVYKNSAHSQSQYQDLRAKLKKAEDKLQQIQHKRHEALKWLQ